MLREYGLRLPTLCVPKAQCAVIGGFPGVQTLAEDTAVGGRRLCAKLRKLTSANHQLVTARRRLTGMWKVPAQYRRRGG